MSKMDEMVNEAMAKALARSIEMADKWIEKALLSSYEDKEVTPDQDRIDEYLECMDLEYKFDILMKEV